MPLTVSRPDPFQAVADPVRRAILDRLRSGDAPVTEIVADVAADFAISRPAVSKHLRVLREARLVRDRRGGDDGRQRVYQLTPAPLQHVAQWALAYQAFWEANLRGLKQHLERPSEPSRAARPPRRRPSPSRPEPDA